MVSQSTAGQVQKQNSTTVGEGDEKENYDLSHYATLDDNADDQINKTEMTLMLQDLNMLPEEIDLVIEHLFTDTQDSVSLASVIEIIEASDADEGNDDGIVGLDEMGVFAHSLINTEAYQTDDGTITDDALNNLLTDNSTSPEDAQIFIDHLKAYDGGRFVDTNGELSLTAPQLQAVINDMNGNMDNNFNDPTTPVTGATLEAAVSVAKMEVDFGPLNKTGEAQLNDNASEADIEASETVFEKLTTAVENGTLTNEQDIYLEKFMFDMLSHETMDLEDPASYATFIQKVLGNGDSTLGAERLHIFGDHFLKAIIDKEQEDGIGDRGYYDIFDNVINNKDGKYPVINDVFAVADQQNTGSIMGTPMSGEQSYITRHQKMNEEYEQRTPFFVIS